MLMLITPLIVTDMKSTILSFIFILCFSHFMKALDYEYVPLVNEEHIWSYCDARRIGSGPVEYDLKYFHFQIKGDTVIQNITYKKVYADCSSNPTNYAASIREENKKVYVVKLNEQQEKLTYDFNMEVGDRIQIDDYRYYEVSKIDMIEIAGKLRKCYNDFYGGKMIEGIGTLSGNFFLYPFDGILLYDIGRRFNYQKQGSEIVYKTNEFYFNADDCDPVATNKIKKANDIQVVFNPANNQFQIIGLSSGNSYSFELIDITGKRLMINSVSKDNNCFNVNNLIQGLYIYRLSENTKTSLFGKIVIEHR